MKHTLRVWDLPTRLFHWLIAASVIGLVVTAKVGGNAMVWHFRLGHAVIALLLFRLVWGLVGGHWSRFRAFLFGPSALLDYLRGQAPLAHRIGHNPLGGLSVLALLGLLALQAGTGLFSDDEIAFAGPLVKWVDSARVALATHYHKQWGQWLVLGSIGLHLLAIAYYVAGKRETLIRPMLSGNKTVAQRLPESRDGWRPRVTALAVLAACVGLSAWLSAL